MRPTWMDRAACAGLDPEMFFPERGQSTMEAKAVCRGCDVRAECLDLAMRDGELSKVGVWGGLSERQRRALRVQRRVAMRQGQALDVEQRENR